jgi:cytoskeletal protein RodZ
MNILTIGARLKKIRLEKGLSLEEVHKKTKIHLNILKAIEGESLTDLSPIYLKSFLKIYAKFLGVDPKDYASDYKGSAQSKAGPGLVKDSKLKLSSFRPSRELKRAVIILIIILVSSVLLFKLGRFLALKHKNRLAQVKVSSLRLPVTAVKKEKKSREKAALVSVHKVDLKEKPVTRKEVFSGIRLTIRARQNCWVSLKSDGKVVFQRILEKGRFETWSAKDKIELSIGNAAAVELEVNDQHFDKLGRNGQALKNIIITKEGLRVPQ